MGLRISELTLFFLGFTHTSKNPVSVLIANSVNLRFTNLLYCFYIAGEGGYGFFSGEGGESGKGGEGGEGGFILFDFSIIEFN